MRHRRLLLPLVTVFDAVVWRARRQAYELVHDVLIQGLSDDGHARLDALPARRDDRGATWLSWLRNPPLSPSTATSPVFTINAPVEHLALVMLALPRVFPV